MPDPSQGALDPWGMAWVHQVYRREFGLVPGLVRGVAVDDRDRSARIAEHITDMALSLQEHHQNEDSILWPPLLARTAPDSSVVQRMEQEHEQLHKLLLQTFELTARWREDPIAANRDALASLLDQVSAASNEHMADEEARLMPLVRQHITHEEWQEFESRGAESIPADKALMFLGMGLEDATPHEREKLLGVMPPEVIGMWEQTGAHEYERMRAELLGQS
jgi:iron-sulfur cluster repair protein YtfE (RIC family)